MQEGLAAEPPRGTSAQDASHETTQHLLDATPHVVLNQGPRHRKVWLTAQRVLHQRAVGMWAHRPDGLLGREVRRFDHDLPVSIRRATPTGLHLERAPHSSRSDLQVRTISLLGQGRQGHHVGIDLGGQFRILEHFMACSGDTSSTTDPTTVPSDRDVTEGSAASAACVPNNPTMIHANLSTTPSNKII